MQSVIPTVPSGFWYATPENEWKDLFWHYLPHRLTIDTPTRMEAFYQGESTLYIRKHIEDWLRPMFS